MHESSEQFAHGFIRERPSPADRPGEVIAGAQREHGDRRVIVPVERIQRGQHPADCAVAATDHYSQLRQALAKHLQSANTPKFAWNMSTENGRGMSAEDDIMKNRITQKKC